jgi:hypothetical protein
VLFQGHWWRPSGLRLRLSLPSGARVKTYLYNQGLSEGFNELFFKMCDAPYVLSLEEDWEAKVREGEEGAGPLHTLHPFASHSAKNRGRILMIRHFRIVCLTCICGSTPRMRFETGFFICRMPTSIPPRFCTLHLSSPPLPRSYKKPGPLEPLYAGPDPQHGDPREGSEYHRSVAQGPRGIQ